MKLDTRGYSLAPQHAAPDFWYYEERNGLHCYFHPPGGSPQLVAIIPWRKIKWSFWRHTRRYLALSASAGLRITGRDVHREWRDGMLAQGRTVAPERMTWETLSEQDKALDERIAAALGASPRGEPADPGAVAAVSIMRALERIVHWMLGEIDDFPARPDGAGLYWWRTELRRRFEAAVEPIPPASEPTKEKP